MQASPVQTRSVFHRKVNVEPQLNEQGGVQEAVTAVDFDWNGVRLEAICGTGVPVGDEKEPTNFMVTLRVRVQNKEGKKCPYLIDVEIVALLDISSKLPAARREDLATVNGLAIVYGATRELILNLTSRMEYGPLTLPGVNFQDQAKNTPTAAPATLLAAT